MVGHYLKKLLLIEDDNATAQSYAEHFADEYEVCISKNGEEGLREAEEIMPNVILLDIMLPGKLNGFDVLRELKQRPQTANIPIIMLTNLDDQRKAALEFGAAECFVKANTDIDEVSKAIRSAVQGSDNKADSTQSK